MICHEVFLPASLAFVLFLNSLPGEFCYDDSRAIKRNPDVLGETSLWSIFGNDFWGTPLLHSGSHKSYRPLCTITFRLNYMIAGLSPFGFHLFNVIIHSLNTGLYSATLLNVIGSRRVSLLAGLMFASHPIHTEAVSGIVGRADMLCCFFFLLALNLYKRYCQARDVPMQKDCGDADGNTLQRVPAEAICQKTQQQRILRMIDHHSAAPGKNSFDADDECNLAVRRLPRRRWMYVIGFSSCVLCAMLSKEQGISVIFVCILQDIFINRKLTCFQVTSVMFGTNLSGLRRGVLLNVVVFVAFVSLRLYLIGMNPPTFSPSDNPASDNNSLLTRTLTFLFLPAFNFGLLLCPLTLSFDWSMDSVELVHSPKDYRNVISFLFYSAFLCLVCKIVLNINRCRHMESHCHNNVVNKIQTATDQSISSSSRCSLSSAPLNWRSKCFQKSCTEASNISEFDSTFAEIRWHGLLFGLSILVFPFVPASNLFFYVGFVVAERVLYIPSMGFCLLVSLGIHLLIEHPETKPHPDVEDISDLKNGKHNGTASVTSSFFSLAKTRSDIILRISDGVSVFTFLLLVLFSCKTILRNEDWLTEEALYKSGISVNPAKAWGNLANVLNSRGKIREAEHAYKTALLFRNNMADVHYNLGILYQEQSRFAEAIQSYERAIQCRPRLTMAHLNLGIVLATVDRKSEAEQVYRHCSEIDTSGLKDPRLHEHTKISALYNLGRLMADMDRHEEAVAAYMKAVDKKPPQYPAQSIYNMLGESYARLDQLDTAEFFYRQALQVKPDHVPAHLTLAKLYHRQGHLEEAEKLYLKSLSIDPTDCTVHQHYGQFLGEVGRAVESADSYLKAAKFAPVDFEIIFNTANALRSIGRNSGAEEYYRRASEIQPETALTHMNLGAILHYNGKLREAEKSYLRALELRPGDVVTESNLNKLRSLMERKRNSNQSP